MLAEMGLSVALATVSGAPQGIERGSWGKEAAVIGAGMAADLALTEYALATQDGIAEGNPLWQSRGMRLGSAMALTLASSYAIARLERDGDRATAGAVRGLLVGQKAGAIGVNAATVWGPGLTSGKAWSIVGGAAVVGAVVGWVRARK